MSIFSFLGSLLGLSGQKRQGIAVSKHSANAGLPIIYGRMRVPAIKVFKTVSRNNVPVNISNYDEFFVSQVSNDHEEVKKAKEFLHRIDVWAQGPITDIARYYVDGDPHTVSRLASRPYFRAVGYYGKDNQTAFTSLSAASNRWTSNHRGRGVAYSATRFFAHGKKPQFNGEPEVEAEIVGGTRYDPRLDSTQPGGLGPQRKDDPSTWAFSDTWALCILDYLRDQSGRGLTNDELHFPSFMAVADKNDVAVTIPTPLTNTTGTPVIDYWNRLEGGFFNIGVGNFYPAYREWQGVIETTQKRHALNIALDPKDTVKINVLKLLNGIRGDLQFSQGKYKLTIEDVEAATVYDFDHDTILGGLKIEYGGRSKRLNRVTLEYKNRNKDYKEDAVSWPNLQSVEYAALLAEDQGEALHQTVQGDGITDFYQAEDLAEFIVRSSRIGITVSLRLAPVGSLLEPNDVIGITHDTPGWVNKWFRVQSVKVNEDFTAEIVATEYDVSIYTWSPKSNEPLNTSDDLPNPWDEPPAIHNLGAIAAHNTKVDGTVISGFNVTWEGPIDTNQINYIEIAWKLTSETEYNDVTRVQPGNISASISGLTDGKFYNIRLTYRTTLGQISEEVEILRELSAASNTKLGGIEEGANKTISWLSGNGVPAPGFGAVDDKYINFDNGHVFEKTAASTWTFQYDTTGIDGTAGDVWHNGDGAPSSELGTIGDMYLNNLNSDYYQKTAASTWTLRGDLKGDGIFVEYSFDGTTNWHWPFVNGDIYMRQRVGQGVWSDAIQIVGGDGQDGAFWYTGTGAPAGGLGKDGDFFLRQDTNEIYGKSGLVWVSNFALTDNLGVLAGLDQVGSGQMNVATLSAIVANVGLITAGILRSTDSKMIVDLNAKKILIES